MFYDEYITYTHKSIFNSFTFWARKKGSFTSNSKVTQQGMTFHMQNAPSRVKMGHNKSEDLR